LATPDTQPGSSRIKRTDEAGVEEKAVAAFSTKIGPDADGETLMKVSDFRSVGGVLLPHRWTTTVNGQTTETLDILSYDVNPADIADKFTKQRVLMRTRDAQK
jgi:hypothetical protein